MTRGYYAVLAKVSLSYPPLQGRLVTCYSPVRHFTHGLLHFLVRLACVRHAASVDSEPGSNSRLKPDVFLLRRRSDWVDRPAHLHLEGRRHLTCENDRAKLDHISRLACSTNLSKILEGGPPKRYPYGSRSGLSSGCPRTWCASPHFSATKADVGVFARTF